MAKQAQQSTEPKVEKVNRVQAANRVVAELKGKTTLTELAAKADALVVAGGGKSKPGTSAYHVRRVLETAEALGAVKLTRPTDITVEKAK